jgi:hypothetical protein
MATRRRSELLLLVLHAGLNVGGLTGERRRRSELLLLLLLATLIVELARDVSSSAHLWANKGHRYFVLACNDEGLHLGWFFVGEQVTPACGGEDPILDQFFVGLQVSFLLLRAMFVISFEEFFFQSPVVGLAAMDLVLTVLGEEVADVCSMNKLRLDGGGGSPDLAALNSCLASSWFPVRVCAGQRWCRSSSDINGRCVGKLGNFTNRSLGLCLFISLSSRVLYVKWIVIFYFI